MIVKLVIHERKDAISLWSVDGDRLYYSDQQKDIDFAINLIKPDNTAYFNAMWMKKIVQLKKRATGYTW